MYDDIMILEGDTKDSMSWRPANVVPLGGHFGIQSYLIKTEKGFGLPVQVIYCFQPVKTFDFRIVN